MKEKAKRLLAVWATLTDEEIEDAIELINEYQDNPSARKKALVEKILRESYSIRKSTTITFGPIDERCPYCGK